MSEKVITCTELPEGFLDAHCGRYRKINTIGLEGKQ